MDPEPIYDFEQVTLTGNSYGERQNLESRVRKKQCFNVLVNFLMLYSCFIKSLFVPKKLQTPVQAGHNPTCSAGHLPPESALSQFGGMLQVLGSRCLSYMQQCWLSHSSCSMRKKLSSICQDLQTEFRWHHCNFELLFDQEQGRTYWLLWERQIFFLYRYTVLSLPHLRTSDMRQKWKTSIMRSSATYSHLALFCL